MGSERVILITDALPAQQVVTGSQGKATATFTGAPQGWYRIQASSQDERGRTVKAENYVWIFDANMDEWWYPTNDELLISADRASYAPGAIAQLLIQARVTGTALLTLEREEVLWEQIVQIDGPLTSVDVPIGAAYAPNVHVRLQMFEPTTATDDAQTTEGRLLSAVAELVVPATDKQLKVEVTLDAAQYKPGANALLSLLVTDAAGNPVKARVGLALVDEAIFALQEDLCRHFV